MTLLSRKKRQTTPLSSPQTNNPVLPIPLRAWVSRITINILTSFVGIILLTTSVAAQSQLQWRSAGTAKRSANFHYKNESKSVSEPAPFSARATQINPLRSSAPRVDSSVRPVAYENEAGPRFANAVSGETEYRSVVVERSDAFEDGFRSAQAPSAGSSSAGGAIDEIINSPTGRPESVRNQSTDPAGDLPPLEDPSLDDFETAPPLPDNGTQIEQRPQNQQPISPIQRQPGQFQPNLPDRPPVAAPLPSTTPSLSEEAIEAERQKSQAACVEGFEDLRENTIDKLSLNIVVAGEPGADFPYECTLDEGAWHGGRCWEQTTYMWKASALCHKPLYFEDEQLERYGHSWSPCLQPFVSGAHFFTRLPVLPYCMGVEPPCECIYSLGHYRPGNCAPYMCNPIPLSPRGAVFQAGAVVGAAAALP